MYREGRSAFLIRDRPILIGFSFRGLGFFRDFVDEGMGSCVGLFEGMRTLDFLNNALTRR